MTLKLFAPSPLLATANPRVKRGLLLPYGEYGFTNKGKVTASAGALTLAEKPNPLTLEHVDKLPVADFLEFEEEADGLYCSLEYPDTPLGNAALAEFDAGTRNGLSVEVDQPVIRNGRLAGGIVTGGSQVEAPAFPSAKLAAAELDDAPDEGEYPEYQTVYEGDLVPAVQINGEAVESVTKVSVSEKTIDITTTQTTEPDPGTDQEETNMTAARVQNAALVAATPPKNDANALFASLAGGFAKGLTGHRLEAALSDIINPDILGVEQPQYVGELWNGVPYERRFIPLFNQAPLTSWNLKGWQFKEGKTPEVDLYTGDKADIPSGDVETEEVSGVLQRFAGGHDIDRRFRDFSVTEFWEAYFRKVAESYAKKSDRYVRDVAKAIPTAGNGGRVHLSPTVMPADVPPALALIVKGALKMLNSDLEVMPTFAMVTADYWEELFYTPKNEVLEYLSTSLNLKGGEVENFKLVPVPTGSLTVGAWVGKVLIGHSAALTVHELPGSPIRVEAEAIAKGGIDEALFGYVGTLTQNAKGIISYDAPSA